MSCSVTCAPFDMNTCRSAFPGKIQSLVNTEERQRRADAAAPGAPYSSTSTKSPLIADIADIAVSTGLRTLAIIIYFGGFL